MGNKACCVSCGNSQYIELFVAKEKMFGINDSFNYLECKACSSIQIVDKPDDISKYYPEKYYAFIPLNKSSFIRSSLKYLRWGLYKRRLLHFSIPEYFDWLLKLEAHKNDAIADIGCGNGQLLYELRCAGFSRLSGFDPYIEEELNMRHLNIYKKGIEEIEGKFDIVMLHHSFEHMEFPGQVFKTIYKILNPKGKVLIRLPVTDGEVWKTEKTNWFQLDAPRHFFIPSVKALEKMGNDNNFKLNRVEFDSNEMQFIGTECYKKGMSFVSYDIEKEHSKQEIETFKKKAEEFNRLKKGDQACFYFEKNKNPEYLNIT